jgi:hypothetical protein
MVRPSRAQRGHPLPELVLVDLAAGESLGEGVCWAFRPAPAAQLSAPAARPVIRTPGTKNHQVHPDGRTKIIRPT